MRRITIFFALALMVSVSCSKDEDLLDAVLAEEATENTDNSNNPDNNNGGDSENGSDQPNPPGDPGPPVDYEGTLVVNDTPCDFSLNTLEANATLELDCRIDLGGQTVNLPSGVTLKYTGGEIINGILSFSGGFIDGELLNKDLELTGEVALTSDIFQLYPERWALVQGQVDDATARNNRDVLEGLFFRIKDLGGYRFEIGTFDAYFKVDDYLNLGAPSTHAINVPGDFHLAMSDATFLRTQPNGHFRPTLIAILNVQNTIVSGGNLLGDRETHNYNSGFVDSDGTTSTTHEWAHVFRVHASQNVLIDNVTIRNATGDGLYISSLYHHFDPRHIESRNITIRNSRIIASRRTNLVITEGRDIFIENNEIIDGGIDMSNSDGVAPSSNLNIEPVRTSDTEYQRVSHVYIRNNTQLINDPSSNPRAGSFQISHGNGPIIIENNEMINTGVSFHTVDGVIIRNNSFTNGGIDAGAGENFGRTDVVYGNEVVGNTVISGGTGIMVAGNGVSVRDNIVEGEVGIGLGMGAKTTDQGLSNSEILNNQITGFNRGFLSQNTMYNVLIDGNIVNMAAGSNFAFTITNQWSGSGSSDFVISNNQVYGEEPGTTTGAPPALIGANSISVLNNDMGEVQINGGRDMFFEGNNIDPRVGRSGFWFRANSPNAVVRTNRITTYPNSGGAYPDCTRIDSGVSMGSITIENNECIQN